MRFASLGSGSKGNSTIIVSGATSVLLDCGFGIRSTCARLLARDVAPETITAILITHEHSDHWKGVEALSAKFDIPVYLSAGQRTGKREYQTLRRAPRRPSNGRYAHE